MEANTTPLFPATYCNTSYASHYQPIATSSAARRCASSCSSHDAVSPITKGARPCS